MQFSSAHTLNCANHGFSEVRLVYDAATVEAEDLRTLLSAIEQAAADNNGISNDGSFQWGWMEMQARLNDRGTLSLLEPDMIHNPINWVDSVTHSLMHYNVQTTICSRSGMNPLFPRQLDQAHICEHLGLEGAFFLLRQEPVVGTAVGSFSAKRTAQRDLRK